MRKLERIKRQGGVTLAEMLITVCVLSLAAAVAVPRADPVSAFAAEAAAGEVARTLRFAQREAVRTSAWHVVSFDTAAQSLRVYRITAGGSLAGDPTKRVQHPVDKRDYQIGFSGGAAAMLASAAFKYEDNTTTSAIGFDPAGSPADIRGWSSRDIYALKDGKIVIANGNARFEVVVEPDTGRVTF